MTEYDVSYTYLLQILSEDREMEPISEDFTYETVKYINNIPINHKLKKEKNYILGKIMELI